MNNATGASRLALQTAPGYRRCAKSFLWPAERKALDAYWVDADGTLPVPGDPCVTDGEGNPNKVAIMRRIVILPETICTLPDKLCGGTLAAEINVGITRKVLFLDQLQTPPAHRQTASDNYFRRNPTTEGFSLWALDFSYLLANKHLRLHRPEASGRWHTCCNKAAMKKALGMRAGGRQMTEKTYAYPARRPLRLCEGSL